MRLREAGEGDLPVLAGALAAAADWRPGTPQRSGAEALTDPHLSRYLAGWPLPGDAGVVALDADGTALGAAWYRLLPASAPGYGFVADDVPELALGVRADARGRGHGSALLAALLERADRDGRAAVSLSVEPDNPAVRLYARHGFVVVGGEGALTMLRRAAAPGG